MRKALIAAGVRNLKEFGYPSATAENILTDQIFASFFERMLEETLERSPRPSAKLEITQLLREIRDQLKAGE